MKDKHDSVQKLLSEQYFRTYINIIIHYILALPKSVYTHSLENTPLSIFLLGSTRNL